MDLSPSSRFPNGWGNSPTGERVSSYFGDRQAELLDHAVELAHRAGRSFASTRRWVEEEAIEKQPLILMGAAFALGVFTGWLIKRR